MQDKPKPTPGQQITPGSQPQNQPQTAEPAPTSTDPPEPEPAPTAPEPTQEEAAAWAYTDDANPASSQADIGTIEWSASEYIAHEKSPQWFATSAAAAAGVAAVIYLVTKELLASITIIVVAFVAMFFSARRPETRTYKLSPSGLQIDGKRYALSDFRSFSVVQEGAIESIWLETLGKFSPTIRLYFAPEDGSAITDALSQFLPYNQRELDVVERASRRIRF